MIISLTCFLSSCLIISIIIFYKTDELVYTMSANIFATNLFLLSLIRYRYVKKLSIFYVTLLFCSLLLIQIIFTIVGISVGINISPLSIINFISFLFVIVMCIIGMYIFQISTNITPQENNII